MSETKSNISDEFASQMKKKMQQNTESVQFSGMVRI